MKKIAFMTVVLVMFMTFWLQPDNQQKAEVIDAQNPDMMQLPQDVVPLNPVGLDPIDIEATAHEPIMSLVQPIYHVTEPELDGLISSEFDPKPKKRTGGYNYLAVDPENHANYLATIDDSEPGIQPQALVSSFGAGGQITNTVNNGGVLFIPADPHGAAGPNHVVNVFNTSIEFYNKDGSGGSSSSLQSFFAPVLPVNFTFDPKVLYDQYEDRWVVVTLQRTDTSNGDPSNTSNVFVAVSATSDPNGAWFMTSINSNVFISGANRWFDYPGLAVDEEVIYLNGNMFGYGGGSYGGVRLWIIDKAAFYAGGAPAVNGPLDPLTVAVVSPRPLSQHTPMAHHQLALVLICCLIPG